MTTQSKYSVLLPILATAVPGVVTVWLILVVCQGEGAVSLIPRTSATFGLSLAAAAAAGLGWILLRRREASWRAAQAAAERHRQLVETIGDLGIIRLDRDGRIETWNAGALRITGFAAGDIIGQPCGRLHLAEESAAGRPAALLERARAEGRAEEEGWRLRRDGTRFWASSVLTPITGEGGVAGFAMVLRDLTGWRHIQLDMQATANRLKLILDTVAEGIYGVDEENRILFANRAAIRLLGWPSAEAACPPESDAIRRTLRDGRTRSVADECFTRAGGEPLPVDYTVAPLVAEDVIAGAVVVFRDVAEKRQREREIVRLLAFQQAILDAAGNAIIATDSQGTITLFNRAAERILGYGAAEMVGKATPEVFHDRAEMDRVRAALQEETGQAVAAGFDSLVAGARLRGSPDIDEWTYLRKDGSRLPVLQAVSVLKGAHGIDGYLGVSQDISRLKALERELKRSNTELEHFAYAASHDLRQPLRMIGSHLTLLQRHLKDGLDEEAREFIGFAVDGAKRMDRMIADLLDYSRIGRKTGPMEVVPLADVAQRVLRHLEFAIAEAEARVTLADRLPVIYGNPLEMERLLQNLLSNALKFRVAGRPPEITLASRPCGEDWLLSVRDNGIGIDPQQIGRLFTIFQRLVSRERYEGTGIGLAACRKIVEHHGGRIWVESVPDEGSVFHVTLPRAISAEAWAQAGEAKAWTEPQAV